jgi:hypothetical protein
MEINYVTTRPELDNLYNQSALTWEGMTTDEENLRAIRDWLELHGALENGEPIFHIISGEFMNSTYGLTGDNAYPDDLSIISVTNINIAKLIIARFTVGARWFDDIVDNNASREGM